MGLEELTDPALRRAMERLFAAYRGLWSNPAALLARRVFTWIDCLVNACYLQGQEAEARLLEAAGQADRAAAVRGRRARGLRTLLDRCWDEHAGPSSTTTREMWKLSLKGRNPWRPPEGAMDCAPSTLAASRSSPSLR